MSKPPAVPSATPLPRPSLQEGIARLRAATGKAEKRVMFRVCSRELKSFTVTYERTDPRERFKIALIEKIEPVSAADTLHGKSVAAGSGPVRTDNRLTTEARTLLPKRR